MTDHLDKLDRSSSPSQPQQPHTPRPFPSVLFKCCSVYARIYKTPDGSAYRGRCPKCLTPIQFLVGQGGTDSRFFVVE